MALADIKKEGRDHPARTIRMIPPEVKIKINKVKREYNVTKKTDNKGIVNFDLDNRLYEKYEAQVLQRKGLTSTSGQKVLDITDSLEKREFSAYMLVAEIARYFNNEEISCLLIKETLEKSSDGMEKILQKVNAYNDILYDVVIPVLFNHFYKITSTETPLSEEICLVKVTGENNFVCVRRCDDALAVSNTDDDVQDFVEKSFNLNCYCFDSVPEKEFFKQALGDDEIEKIYFTGMLLANETEFVISYIDPTTSIVRNYFPDFLIKTTDKKWHIIEVKADFQMNDPVVLAKEEAARQMSSDSNFTYHKIEASRAKEMGWSSIYPDRILI